MPATSLEAYREGVFAAQDARGAWFDPDPAALRVPEWRYYVPVYQSSLWTMLLLADLDTPASDPRFARTLSVLVEHFSDARDGVFSIGDSHYPIPCLNGNLLYLMARANDARYQDAIDRVVNFFARWQRFDDGDFSPAKDHPFRRNRSCYGSHTCFWGVVKLFKGLSFIPPAKRSPQAQELLQRCIEFVLLHRVCFSSHHPDKPLNKIIVQLFFPCMYTSNLVEVLWLLAREGVRDARTIPARELLLSLRHDDGTWHPERSPGRLAVAMPRQLQTQCLTQRAEYILNV